MKNYVIINGTNSNTLTGLMINELPPITKPEMRTQVEEIDGRDGDIITKLGYSAYDKTITIGLFGTGYDVDNIIKFFNKEGTIVFSNEPDKYYNFTQVNDFDIERLLKFKTASITFHCQPFKYPIIETQKIIQPTILTSEGESITINNTASDSLKLSLKGNTSQASTPTPTSPVAVNVVSGDNDVKIEGVNLFEYPYTDTTKTANGITFTDNGDGTITINGTASAETIFYLKNNGWAYSSSSPIYAGTYTLSRPSTNDNIFIYINIYDIGGTNESKYAFNSSTTFTISGTKSLNMTRIVVKNGAVINNVVVKPQLEKSSSASTYQPYTSQTYPIDLPVENLFDKTAITTGKSVSASTGALYSDSNSFATDYINVKGIDNIVFNGKSSSNGVWGAYYDDNQQFVSGFSGNYTTLNVSSYSYVRIGILNTYLDTLQIEPGTKTNHYTPYGTTPIELCKIGTYQDYIYKDSGKWYLHKEVKKITLNGTETWTDTGSGYYTTVNDAYSLVSTNTAVKNGTIDYIISNYFGIAGLDTIYNDGTTGFVLFHTSSAPNTQRLCFGYSGKNSTQFKTWLGTNNTTVYYVLKTPTNTEITDTNLISQLDAIEGAYSYETQTNISQTNNDKPFIISASAVQSGTNEITINNIGNIYSKPLIALEGSGNVDIYLDNTQILKANVESKMNIDINTLEAYNPDTSALLNRQVIGNYNSMTFQPGNNKLTINGALNKATITNYTRWL